MAKKMNVKTPASAANAAAPSDALATPIYLKSVTLCGIRCFRGPAQTLDLTCSDGSWAPWTLILGNNGTGKSTLLQAIGRVTVAEGADRKPRLYWEDVPRSDLSGQLKPSGAFTTNLDSQGSDASYTHESMKIQLGQTTEHIFKVYDVFGSFQKNDPNTIPFTWNLFGYGAWRSLGTSTLTEELPTEYLRSHLFSDKADLVNGEEWLLRLDYGTVHHSKFSTANRKRFNQVKDTLIGLLPDVEEIRIGEPTGPDRPPRLLFKTPYGEVELRQLGYGYQSLIAWVVDFAARMYHAYFESPNPLAEPAICLIDEIDLHLHPSWQRKLMSFLSERFPKTQFIATAHSPLIVQAAEEIGANVVVLRREGDHVVIDNDPISVKGWRVDQILSSELFDDTPLRDAESEKWMARRVELLQKDKLTAKEKAELKQLNEKVRELPMASSPEDRNLDRRLKAAVELLEKAAKGSK